MSRSSHALVVLPLVLATAGAAFWLGRGLPAGTRETPAARSGASDPNPRNESARLVPVVARPPGEATKPSPEPSNDAPKQAAAPERKVTFSELRDTVRTEQRDPAWEAEVSSRVRERLAEHVKAGWFRDEVSVERVDCGGHRCTVEASAQASLDAENLGRTLTQGLRLKRGRVYHRKLEGGTEQVQVIAAREGYDIFGQVLPEPELPDVRRAAR